MNTALLLALALVTSSLPQDPALTPDERAAVEELFTELVEPDEPGCAVAIVRDGETVFARGFGLADVEHGAPIGPDTPFRIASTSKQFAAACLVLLERDGVLSLEDDVRRWLPALPAPRGTIRLEHLVHHTSGLRDYLYLMALAGYDDDGGYSPGAVRAALERQRDTRFAPGERFDYSNSNYFLISQVVEAASGKSLRAFAAERLLEPLGMTRSHFHDDRREVVHARATGYGPTADGWQIQRTSLEMCGDGGLFTTVEDLTRWMANFREPRVGDAAFLERLTTRGRTNDGEELDYACGIGVEDWRGLRQLSHSGGFVGFRAEMLHVPEVGFGVVCLANRADFDPVALCARVRDLLLGPRVPEPAVEEPAESEELAAEFVPAEVPRGALEAFEGLWLEEGDEPRRLVTLRARREHVSARGTGAGLRFEPESATVLRGTAGDARLELGTDGLLVLRVADEPDARFVLVPAFEPDATGLAAYAGDWWCEELFVLWRLELAEGALALIRGGERLGTLSPEIEDRFRSRVGRLRFERADGAPARAYLAVDGLGELELERVRR